MKASKEKDKLRQLRRHKQLATGLFLLMVAVYAAMIWLLRSQPAAWMGYVKAFSEAAMVGALADWFAVTALFHHPLGIPIPHTNLIEKSKQRIGDNLGSFVVDNFLMPQNIRPYIQQLKVSAFVAAWLSRQKNKELLMGEVAHLLTDILHKMDDKAVSGFISAKASSLLDTVKLNEIVAQALQYFIARGEHEQLVTGLAAGIKGYVQQNEDMVREKVKEESYFFIPKFIDRKLADKISGALVRYFEEIEQDPEHRIRIEITTRLQRFVEQLRTEERWVAEFRQLKNNLLPGDKLEQYASDIWQSLKQTLVTELSAMDSALLRYFSRSIDELTERLQQDEALRQRIDHWVRLTAYKYILKNTGNVATLISSTVGNWQGRDLSRKLEQEVGKDLQFIRINGTLVGGLVGLLIYTVTQLL